MMRPFLKWLGNKYRCINHLNQHFSPSKRLIEPFAGSAAVFLNTDYPNYLLGEQNQDLINLYKLVAEEGELFINYAKKLFTQNNNQEDRYYQLRDKFNKSKSKRVRSALFLFLNRHGYNGLCRYNSSGGFNVPFGRYVKPYFPEKELFFFHEKAQQAQFNIDDFQTTMLHAESGDLIYCDPPYVPLSASANFTGYTSSPFAEKEQLLLAQLAEDLANKNITVIISNHDTACSRKLYQNATIHSFPVKRTISCQVNSRKPVHELIAIFN